MKMNKKEINEYLGLNRDDFPLVKIKVNKTNGNIIPSMNNDKYIIDLQLKLEKRWEEKTILDNCLQVNNIQWEDETFQGYVQDEGTSVVATISNNIEMKLFPPLQIDYNKIDFPLFEIEFYMEDIEKGLNPDRIVNDIILCRNNNEGNFTYEILSKALRSHKNKISAQIDIDSISQAISLLEKENLSIKNMLFSYQSIINIRKELERKIFDDVNIMIFSPERRSHKNRNFFLSDKFIIGDVIKSNCKINIIDKKDKIDIFCRIRMGAIIYNRDAISAIDEI